MMMKKVIYIGVLWLCTYAIQAQNFVQLHNAIGYKYKAAEVAELEAAVDILVAIFPEEYQQDFKVFDYGYYAYSDAMPCTLIRWSYITDYPETLINFKIYRLDMSMAPNYPLTQGANPEPPYILVKTISPERANEDALQLGFPDNEYVHVDENATDPRGPIIKYKVIAQHRDGGSSEWSEEIVVR